jgi:hypothetical protein
MQEAMRESATICCHQCRHWEGPCDDQRDWRRLFGLCKAIEHEMAVIDRLQEDIGWDMACKKAESIMKMKGAYVTDASDYQASLYTKPDFYCSMFEVRNDA